MNLSASYLLIYQQISRVGILVAHHVEITGLDKNADGIDGGGRASIDIAEIVLVQENGGCHILSGDKGFAILRCHLYIVGYVDGWLEGGKGDGVEDVAPWLIFRSWDFQRRR